MAPEQTRACAGLLDQTRRLLHSHVQYGSTWLWLQACVSRCCSVKITNNTSDKPSKPKRGLLRTDVTKVPSLQRSFPMSRQKVASEGGFGDHRPCSFMLFLIFWACRTRKPTTCIRSMSLRRNCPRVGCLGVGRNTCNFGHSSGLAAVLFKKNTFLTR